MRFARCTHLAVLHLVLPNIGPPVAPACAECQHSSVDLPSVQEYQQGGSSHKRSGSKRSSAGLMSPPFLSPMRHCHSMPSGSRLLGRQ